MKLDQALRSALQAGASRPIAIHNEFLQTPSRKPMGPEPELRAHDRGKGFDPDEARQGRGLGLISMQERVRLLRGTIEIHTAIDAGTDVLVHVPF